MVPLALTDALPLAGGWVITTVAGLRVPSASVSLASTAMVVVAPSATVAVSLPATGGCWLGPAVPRCRMRSALSVLSVW